MTRLEELMDFLDHHASARNRSLEREPRTITITDDEALLLVLFVKAVWEQSNE
jgi:hypothetical protein